MLNSATLTAYCATFAGYGNARAPFWFVGIEESGGGKLEEVRHRLDSWAAPGQKKDLQDAPTFYPLSKNDDWHGSNARLQPTWKQLIRMLLIAQGKSDTPEAMLDYQRARLGLT